MNFALKRGMDNLPMFYINIKWKTAKQANLFGRGLCLN